MVQTDRKKTRLKKFGLALTTLAFSLLMAEIVIRKFLPTVPEGGHHRIFVEHHTTLGWQKKAGVTGRHVTSEYCITETMNSRGLRGPEIDYAKPTNTYRIVVLGDSFVEGYTVEFEDLFTEIARQRLEGNPSPGLSYEVINMGTAGYSTDQEILLFEEEGSQYRPDLTVLVFYFNDVWYNTKARYWRGNKPVFRLEDDVLCLHGVPVPFPEKNLWQAFTDSIYEASYFYRLCRDKSARLRRRGRKKKKAHESVPATVRVMNSVPGTETEEAWAVTAAILARMQKNTQKAGSEFLVLYAPTREAVHPEDWKQTRLDYSMTGDGWDPALPGLRLREICANLGISFLDPTDTLRRRAASDGTRFYFKIDRHWNRAGHAAIGEFLANHIASLQGRTSDVAHLQQSALSDLRNTSVPQ